MKKRKNHARRFVVVLSVALIVNLFLYLLPESLLGIRLKKVDLLSDIRKIPIIAPSDEDASLNQAYIEDAVEQTRVLVSHQSKSDSLNKSVVPPVADCLSNIDIEDFTPERTGLKHFFAALDEAYNRPVRIAFMGDSFIEGDILVADFRAKMQEHFGGRGIGYIPATSEVMQFRPTIKQHAKGWKTHSIIHNRNMKYVLSGLLFESQTNEASIQFQTVDAYPRLEASSLLKILYTRNKGASIHYTNNTETIDDDLPPTQSVMQYELQGHFTRGTLKFKNARGLHIIGLALEDDYGVTVDNFSLRSNSGIVMTTLDRDACRQLQSIRPYDLIVVQYGLNVADNASNDYRWYKSKMKEVIAHLRNCFPGADLLLLGVSDRSHRHGGAYSTMPTVMSLLRAQQQIARDANIAFWSIFAAMGGKNGMVKYVQTNRASKDHTHLNFRGGREVANVLYQAILNAKEKYDAGENFLNNKMLTTARKETPNVE